MGWAPEIWGKLIWDMLYHVTFHLETRPIGMSTEKQNRFMRWLQHLGLWLPCPNCQSDFVLRIMQHPCGNQPFQWIVEIHNQIQVKIRKPSTSSLVLYKQIQHEQNDAQYKIRYIEHVVHALTYMWMAKMNDISRMESSDKNGILSHWIKLWNTWCLEWEEWLLPNVREFQYWRKGLQVYPMPLELHCVDEVRWNRINIFGGNPYPIRYFVYMYRHNHGMFNG